MKKKLNWVVIGMLVVLSLLAASCAQPAAPGAPATQTVTTTVTAGAGAPVTKTVTATATKTVTATPGEAAPKAIKWRMQSYYVSTIEGFKITGEQLCDLIRTMSQGRLDITPYSTGEIVGAKEIMDAVGKGVVECGVGVGPYWSGKIPIANMEYGLPQAFKNKVEMDTFMYKKGLIDLVREAYAEHGVYYVGLGVDNGFALLSTKPVNTVDDLKGMKIRAIGAGGELFKQLGASMVSVVGSEIYTALATGVIDGAIYGGFEAQWKLGNHEVCKYIMMPKVMSVHGPNDFLVNHDAWDALPDDLKVIVDTAWRLAAENFYMWKYGADIEYLAKMKDYGLQVITLSEADQAKMAAAAGPVWDTIAAKDSYCAEAVALMKEYLKELGRG